MQEIFKKTHTNAKGLGDDFMLKGDSVHAGNVDMVNSPPHYKTGKIECIEAMQAMLTDEEFIGYLRGNAFKYLWRYRNKGKAHEDLAKAQWYLNKLSTIHDTH